MSGSLPFLKFAAEFAIMAIALFAAWRAYKEANRAEKHMKDQKRNWDAQNLIYLHQFLSQQRYAEARKKLWNGIKNNEPYSPDLDDDIDLVSAAYDQAGFIILKTGHINDKDKEKLLRSSWGYSIIELYQEVRHFELDRDSDDSDLHHTTQNFFWHFRDLYAHTCDLWGHDKIDRW